MGEQTAKVIIKRRSNIQDGTSPGSKHILPNANQSYSVIENETNSGH